MDQVPLIDQSGLYTLEDIVFDLEQLGNTSITGQLTKNNHGQIKIY
jgi:SulP family sulfate permease